MSKGITEEKQEEIVKEFCEQYKTFDDKGIIERLSNSYQQNARFHLRVPLEIKYISRKYQLTENIWNVIYEDLLADNVDDETKVSLARALKYSVKKGNLGIDLVKLVMVLQKNCNTRIRCEIIWSSGYLLQNSFFKHSKLQADEELIRRIDSIVGEIEDGFAMAPITFLHEQIRTRYNISHEKRCRLTNEKIRTSIRHPKRTPQLVLTKNRQTHQTGYRNTKSEELANKNKASNIFHNLNKQIHASSNREILPNIPDEDGRDTHPFQTTYQKVVLLYNRMNRGHLLKRKDKDEYLPSKFIKPREKWRFDDRKLSVLFIDLMTAQIFLEASKKQSLHDNAVNSLMECVDSIENLGEKIFGRAITAKIIDYKSEDTSIIRYEKAYKSAPVIIRDIAQKIDDSRPMNDETALEILRCVVRQVRLAAISAIYNCAKRNSSMLTEKRLKKIEKRQNDDDVEFTGFIIKILGTLADSNNIDYENLFETCLRNLEQNVSVSQSIEYIYQQSKDECRSQELFTDDVIFRIKCLCKSISLDNQTKILCYKSINHCLEHSYNTGLNASQLAACISILEDLKSTTDLKVEVLKSIVLTVEKTQQLPDFIVESLVENLDAFNAWFDNYVIIALEFVAHRQLIANVDRLAAKLLEQTVIVGEGANVIFEEASKENSDCQSISSIVAEIFVQSLQKNVQINDQSLQYLVQALSRNDSQTCIISAKALYLASENHQISNDILINLKSHTESRLYDVSVYTSLVYVRGLEKLSSINENVMTSHIDFLPKIYPFNDLQLGHEDFTDTMNDNILFVLFSETSKQKFNDHVFRIFEHILFFRNQNQRKTIELLNIYSAKGNSLPESTITALDSAFDIDIISDQVLSVFKNIIKNRQMVSEKILHVIADTLYLHDDCELRDESFHLLDAANDNQDISDEIFEILELERASRSIQNFLPDRNDAIYYLYARTKEGHKLTLNCFRALNVAIDEQPILNIELLKILLSTSNNGQMIPDDLVSKLVAKFDPTCVCPHLLEIFENLVKNNQKIPVELSEKLELVLVNPLVSDRVLFIFVHQAQKGLRLPESIIYKILDKFLTIENALIMQQYLSVICIVIQKKLNFEYASENYLCQERFRPYDANLVFRVQNALIHALEKGNEDIVRQSVNGLKTLMSLGILQLETEGVRALVNLATKTMCDEIIKEDICLLLEKTELEDNQKCVMQLSSLKLGSDEQFLDKLYTLNEPKLLEQNFEQINNILNNCFELRQKALEILLQCSNKERIPRKLLDSIAVLLASTSLESIRSLCCRLVVETVQAGGEVGDKMISLVLAHGSHYLSKNMIHFISNNRSISKELHDQINFSSVDSDHIEKFFYATRQQLRDGLTVSNVSIEKLLSILIPNADHSNKDNDTLEKEQLDLFALIFKKYPNCSSSERIISIVQKAILDRKISKYILNAYMEVINLGRCLDSSLSQALDICVEMLEQTKEHHPLYLDILKCIALASKSMGVFKLTVLENNLFSNIEVIRNWSFIGLRGAYERGLHSDVFKNWCKTIAERLRVAMDIDIDPDMDLFETITSLKYVDYKKLQDKPQNQWSRELLIFDLVERYAESEEECFHFYVTWLELEKQKTLQTDQSDQLLKLLHRCQLNETISFQQCYDLIKILSHIEFKDAQDILSDSINPCLDLQKKYLGDIINKRLTKQNDLDENYIVDLASRMVSKFGFDLSDKLLQVIEKIENLVDLENFFVFVEQNTIKSSDIYVQNASIKVLKRSLEIKLLGNHISKVDRYQLGALLDYLLDKGWTFELLNSLFSDVRRSTNAEKERKFVNVLEILVQYKILPSEENAKKLSEILQKPLENWLYEVNRLAVEVNFSELGRLKNAAELIEELKDHNTSIEELTNLNENSLLNIIENIKRSDLISQILKTAIKCSSDKQGQPIPIAQWTKEQIREWAELVKENRHVYMKRKDFKIEVLAVVKQATFLDSSFYLTDIQVIGLLMLLNKSNDKGRLLQVATGEGKSTIISAVAVFHALEGKKVDIITSSPVLAQRDAKEKTKFYDMFGLQCSDNNDRSIYLSGPKMCYRKQIVYGEVAQFQFDTLRTEYAQLNTLEGRNCEIAVVDEVDSMLLDDSSKIARLATTMSGMDQLHLIYHLLWSRLVILKKQIFVFNKKFYLLYGQISFDQNRAIMEYTDERGELNTIADLESYLASSSNFSHIGESVPESVEIDDFIKAKLREHVNMFIGKQIKIPNILVNFVDKQLPKWIDNAYTAFYYQENIHYVIQDGQIKPVDYCATGIVQSATSWNDGLHQFLQIKHNLKMTSENLTTNFLSNRGYFRRYGSNLIGLTGTLGSEKAKHVLADVYQVDIVMIPNLRRKQYLSISDIATLNKTEWLEEISRRALIEARKRRGTLIICETIEDSILLADNLRPKCRSGAIKLYTMNDMNQERHIQKIGPGEIIIATNLAGRGTDIKTDEIEENGGLHVIVTFVPSNKRVEEQAFGRTARQGRRGTGQKIFNITDLMYYENCSIRNIMESRDRLEANMLTTFQEHDLKIIVLKDKLFAKFCSLLNKIRQKIRTNNGWLGKRKHQIKSIFTYDTFSSVESNIIISIEERWAIFLHEIDNQKDSIDVEACQKEYEKFSEKILEDCDNDCIIHNAFRHIAIANALVSKNSLLDDDYDKAMNHFNRAIELDPKHSAAAFAGKGWLLLRGKRRIARSNKQEISYKETAIGLFNQALELLSEEMAVLMTIQSLVQQRCSDINTGLYKQLIQKVNIVGSYHSNLENAVTVIKRSQRLIEITEVVDYVPSKKNLIVGTFLTKSRVENAEEGIFKKIISYDGVEKLYGYRCNIRLIPHTNLDSHESAIENRQEIVITKQGKKTLTINYMKKEKNRLGQLTVDDEELSGLLLSLPGNEILLDRNIHWRIYQLVEQIITSEYGHIRSEPLPSPLTSEIDSTYEIKFNDLTVKQDCGTTDQALETIHMAISRDIVGDSVERKHSVLYRFIDALFDVSSDSHNRCFSVKVQNINAEQMRSFLNPNIEVKDVTKNIALSQLKDMSSFFHRHILPEKCTSNSYPVDLEIISDHNDRETQSCLQIRDAIQLINKRTDIDLRFNLTFISANEAGEIFKDILTRSNLAIEFIGLKGTVVKEKLLTMSSEKIHLEISDSKERLLQVISILGNESIQLYSAIEERSHRTIAEIVNKNTAAKKLTEMTNAYTKIKLFDINQEIITKIIDISPDGNFNVSFIAIEFESLLNGLKDEFISVKFDNLDEKQVITVVTEMRKKNLDFCLIIKNLRSHQAKALIKLAPIEQEDIAINDVKTLNELFMNELTPSLELSEFSERGIHYLLTINEKNFIQWKCVTALCALAAVQMVAGGFLISTGFGAVVGMGLASEGAADFFNAYQAYRTRQFSWSGYAQQKAVSLTISAFSMGSSNIKDAGKGIQSFLTSMKVEVLEQAGTRVVINGRAVGHILAETGKNLKSLSVKQIGVTLGDKALRQCASNSVNFISNAALKQLETSISELIQDKVYAKFCESKLNSIVNKMCALDMLKDQQQLKGRIDRIILEITNPKHSGWSDVWKSIASSLYKNVLSRVGETGDPGGTITSTLGTLKKMYEIVSVVDKAHDELLRQLSEIDRETLSMKQILHNFCGVNKEHLTEIIHLFQKHGIIDQNDEFNIENFVEQISHVDFDHLDKYKNKIVYVFNAIYEKISSKELHHLNEIMKSISDAIVKDILRLIETEILSPWSTYAIEKSARIISEKMQYYFVVNEKETPQYQNGTNLNETNSTVVLRTVAQQINYNSKDYVITYSQCEMIHYSQQKDRASHREIDEKGIEYAANVRNDAPANMSDILALADKYSLVVKIVDDLNYRKTSEEKTKGTHIVLFIRGETNSVGHYQLLSDDDGESNISSTNNDCGYTVIKQLLEKEKVTKTIQNLRDDRATIIENNPEQFAMVLKAQRWIETRYPQEANNLLMIGSGKKPESPNNRTVGSEPDSETVISINEPTKQRKGFNQGEMNKKLKKEAKTELIPAAMKKLANKDGYIEVRCDSDSEKTIFSTENLRLDNQGPTSDHVHVNYQIQLGGNTHYQRRPGKSTTVAHVLLEMPISPNTVYRYRSQDIENALIESMETGETVILRPPTHDPCKPFRTPKNPKPPPPFPPIFLTNPIKDL